MILFNEGGLTWTSSNKSADNRERKGDKKRGSTSTAREPTFVVKPVHVIFLADNMQGFLLVLFTSSVIRQHRFFSTPSIATMMCNSFPSVAGGIRVLFNLAIQVPSDLSFVC